MPEKELILTQTDINQRVKELGEAITRDYKGTQLVVLGVLNGAFIFMADRWNKSDLEDSRYVWLPLRVLGDQVEIEWHDEWSMDQLN